MRRIIIPEPVFETLRRHLFRNKLEQAAFLFATHKTTSSELILEVEDIYLVPKKGWQAQRELYLEMKDEERAKIMKMARNKDYLLIDCHSHIGAKHNAWFSATDVAGTIEFAQYAKWKLSGKPFAAMVWGESSVDAVMWSDDFYRAHKINEVVILASQNQVFMPRDTWTEKRQPADWRA